MRKLAVRLPLGNDENISSSFSYFKKYGVVLLNDEMIKISADAGIYSKIVKWNWNEEDAHLVCLFIL